MLIASSIIIIPISNMSHLAKAQTQPTVAFDQLTVNATQIDQTFTLNIEISNVQNLWGWGANVTFDSAFIKYVSSGEGGFLTSQGASTFYLATKPKNYVDPYSNIETLQQMTFNDAIDSTSNGQPQTASGSGILESLTFEAVAQTSSTSIILNVGELEGPLPTGSVTGTTHPIITPVSSVSATEVSLIIPGPPTANAGKEQSVPVGTQVIFNGSQSVTTGTNPSYTWTFTDGTLQTLTGMIAHYTFNNPGNYTVTLTLTDSLGTSNSTLVIHVLGTQTSATPIPTTAPTQTPSSTTASTSTASTPTPSPQQTNNFTLPPTVEGILVFVTLIVFSGSFFWLRKNT